jgi:DNA-binding NarL/FixJ family response regulator
VTDSPERITIVVADEQSLFREAVVTVFDGQPDLEVVATAGDETRALEQVRRTRPDVILISATLSVDPAHSVQLVTEASSQTRVMVLSPFPDEISLARILEAGANAYVTKGTSLAELIEATRAVKRGETLIPPAMLGPLLSRLIRRRRDQDETYRRLFRLTAREREVLALLAQGADNDGIARALVISPETARTHIQNLLSKLEVHSRLEAAAFVNRHGLFEELVGTPGG